MNTRGAGLCLVICCCIAPLLLGCEDEKSGAASKASAGGAAPAAKRRHRRHKSRPADSAEQTADAGQPPPKIETELTPARRSAIETKYAPTKGFVLASELQAKLKQDKSLKDKKAAVAAFDKLARGKWVLFTGPLVNTTDEGFDIDLEYTPELPNDPKGTSPQFFEVTMTKVDGYTKDAFKAGSLGVVLAKYVGAGKATPGYELVAAGVWK